MATQETTSGETSRFAGPFDPARIELAYEAASEIDAIIILLRREAKSTTFSDYSFEAILRTNLKRISDLAGVGIIVLGRDDEETTEGLHELVWHEAKEAAHV